MIVSIFSLEFLVHAWDYAKAAGHDVDVEPALAEYVLDLARGVITPEGRVGVGVDDPIEPPENAPAMDRLLAFTGRDPGWGR